MSGVPEIVDIVDSDDEDNGFVQKPKILKTTPERNNNVSVPIISPEEAAKIKREVNQQHRARYKNSLEKTKRASVFVLQAATQMISNHFIDPSKTDEENKHLTNRSPDESDRPKCLNILSLTSAPRMNEKGSIDTVLKDECNVVNTTRSELTEKCTAYGQLFISSKNNSTSVMCNSEEADTGVPDLSKLKNKKRQKLVSGLLPFKEITTSSEMQVRNKNNTLLPEQTDEVVKPCKKENMIPREMSLSSKQVQETMRNDDFVNSIPPFSVKSEAVSQHTINVTDLKDSNKESAEIEEVMIVPPSSSTKDSGDPVAHSSLTNDLILEPLTCLSETDGFSDTRPEHSKTNLTLTSCDDKSMPETSNSVSEESKLKRLGSSALEAYFLPFKMPKLSQQLTKHPSKFIGASKSSTDIGTQLLNGVQSPRRKVSPSKRVSKFSPVRFVKNRSPYKKLVVGQSGEKSNVSKKLDFKDSIDHPLQDCPPPNCNNIFDKEPFVDTNNFYVGHFRTMLLDVMADKRTLDLINKEELKVIDNYFKMPPENKELYIRMYNRKFMWHRVSKIKYDLDLTSIFQALENQDFVTSDIKSESLDNIIQLLDVSELKNLCKTYGIPHNKVKKDLIQDLVQFGRCQKVLTVGVDGTEILKQRILAVLGHCIKLGEISRQIFRRMELLFSLAFIDEGREGALNIMRLHNVESGKMVFPTYNIVNDVPIFASREELIRYEEALSLELEAAKAVENKQWEVAKVHIDQIRYNFKQTLKDEAQSNFALKLPIFLRKFTAGSVYAYGLQVGIPLLKKNETDAIEVLKELLNQKVYLPLYRGEWYKELALILYKNQKNNLQVANLVVEAMQDPCVNEVHRHILSTRGTMLLSRKHKGSNKSKEKITKMLKDCLQEPLKSPPFIVLYAKSLPSNKPGLKSVYIQEDHGLQEKTYSSVEELAISHYRTLGFTRGIHCEGSIVMSLFGLMFWDIIYEIPVPNVFQSRYQPQPLDLASEEFYLNRKEAVDKKLLEMESWTVDEVREVIQKNYSEHEGKLCIVNWQWFRSFQDIVDIITCMGTRLLTKLCERLAKSYRMARSGFPDLTLWTPGEVKCKFVEVKGPGDRLSPNQSLWMDFLVNVGANAEVCFVNKTGFKHSKKA